MRRELLPLAVVFAAWLHLGLTWKSSPALVPTHFGLDGRPDAWSDRSALWFDPAMATGLYLLMTLMPLLDEKTGRPLIRGLPFLVFRTGVLLVLLALQVATAQPREPDSMRWFFGVAIAVLVILTAFVVHAQARRTRPLRPKR